MKYKEGDLVSFKGESDFPDFYGTGIIRGAVNIGGNEGCSKALCSKTRVFWLLELKDTPFRKSSEYSCIAVPESWLTLIESHKDAFDRMLASVRESYRRLSDRKHCYGLCEELIKEGPRSYSRKAAIDGSGFCTQCHRKAK